MISRKIWRVEEFIKFHTMVWQKYHFFSSNLFTVKFLVRKFISWKVLQNQNPSMLDTMWKFENYSSIQIFMWNHLTVSKSQKNEFHVKYEWEKNYQISTLCSKPAFNHTKIQVWGVSYLMNDAQCGNMRIILLLRFYVK